MDQDERFDAIVLRYEGLDADRSLVDLGQLGSSLEGAARLLGSAGHVVLTGRFARKDVAASIRVFARPPTIGSFEIVAILAPLIPLAAPLLPIFGEAMKAAATKGVEAIVNTAVARWTGLTQSEEQANKVAITALEQMGYTSRFAIEAVERMAASSRQPIKLLATPVGVSTSSVQVGSAANGALRITAAEKRAIEQAAEAQIGLERKVVVVITELDLLTHHCKVSLASDPDSRRIFGVITDPVVEVPNNPYSKAFDAQTPIEVVAKPRYIGDEIDRMYISNTVASRI